VSHSKERTEKNCLNCAEIVQGRYCQACGQENIEPKESFWGLITHFFQDITHFDGKFFSTGRLLLMKPGFLPKEYISGRRARYLHPIRMYVFSSALFFLIFYSLYNVNRWDNFGKRNEKSTPNLGTAKQNALKNAKSAKDSAEVEDAFRMIERLPVPVTITVNDDSTNTRRKGRSDGIGFFNLSDAFETPYNSTAGYDSAQLALPVAERDGWWNRRIEYRNIGIKQKYGKDNESQLWKDVVDRFMHTFPYLLFFSLPLYALFLKLLYIRRKQFYYVDHALFLIYLYIFTFLFLLVFFGLTEINNRYEHWFTGLLLFALFLYGIYYAYKAMKKFYGQGTGKTILKFIILNILASSALMFLFVLFFSYALLRL
jgi:uncharacterized protein DUF3667